MSDTARINGTHPGDGAPEISDPQAGEEVVRAGGGRRALWTLFDQALSSLTNFALTIIVARIVSADGFGAFTLMLITFSFIIGIGRGLVSDPFVVRYSDVPPLVHRAASARATGAGFTYGIVTGLICAIAGLALSGLPSVSTALYALALALPGLMVQDIWRHSFFAEGRPFAAAMNDLVWTVVQFVLLWLLISSGSRSIFWITVAWGFAALAAAIVGILQTGAVPNPLATFTWFRETRDLNLRMALDFALNMGAVNLAIYAVSAIVGLAGAGALRAAQTLLGPLNLLGTGLSSFVLPVMSRLAGSGRSLIRVAFLTSATCGGIGGASVLVLILLPDALGDQLLGKSWAGADSVMLPSGIIAIAVCCVIGASCGLKALRRADQMLRVTVMQAPFMLGLGVLGAVTNGALGAAWGLAASQVFGMVVCWFIFLRADGQPRTWTGLPDDAGGDRSGEGLPSDVPAEGSSHPSAGAPQRSMFSARHAAS